MFGNFEDDTHALRTGMLIGALIKAGIKVIPDMDDEGNYTPYMTITLDDAIPLFPIKLRIVTLLPE